MKTLYIDKQGNKTRIALVEDEILKEFLIEDASKTNVGNVYKGKVVNVLNGLSAAFVDIGLKKNAYLYFGDAQIDRDDTFGIIETSNLQINFKVGDSIMVQVTKDIEGTKGARVVTNISLAGRYVVLMPQLDYVGISRKIECIDERTRLLDTLTDLRPPKIGVIARTAANNITKKLIKEDMDDLLDKWNKIKKEYSKAYDTAKLFSETEIVTRVLRDMYSNDIKLILVNDDNYFEQVKAYINYIGESCEVNFVYNNMDMCRSLEFNAQLEKLFQRNVDLSNGGYIVIDKTEACTIIDVNTGKFVGKKELEDTVFQTNILACVEIARQLSLRNVGGIIIIDFIDMEKAEHRQQLLLSLKDEVKKDRTKTTVVGMTGLGLVEITRKKSRNNISNIIKQVCPYCNGEGMVFSNDYIVSNIKFSLTKLFEEVSPNSAIITVNPIISEALFMSKQLSEMLKVKLFDKSIYVVSDSSLHIEKYEITAKTENVLTLPNNAKLLY